MEFLTYDIDTVMNIVTRADDPSGATDCTTHGINPKLVILLVTRDSIEDLYEISVLNKLSLHCLQKLDHWAL